MSFKKVILKLYFIYGYTSVIICSNVNDSYKGHQSNVETVICFFIFSRDNSLFCFVFNANYKKLAKLLNIIHIKTNKEMNFL